MQCSKDKNKDRQFKINTVITYSLFQAWVSGLKKEAVLFSII